MCKQNLYLLALILALSGCGILFPTEEPSVKVLEFESIEMSRVLPWGADYSRVIIQSSGDTEFITRGDTLLMELSEAKVREWERLLGEGDFLALDDSYIYPVTDQGTHNFTVETRDIVKSVYVYAYPMTEVPPGLEAMIEALDELIEEIKATMGD